MGCPRMSRVVLAVLAFLAASGSPGFAQILPWDTFVDDPLVSISVCDVVNAANAELVVRSDTGNLVIVSGVDVILQDTVVDLNGSVFLAGVDVFGVEFRDPVGFIDFADDGDGFRTLWWTSLTGTVVNVDDFTGELTSTDLFPSDFIDVPCDACPFWDDPTVCNEEPLPRPPPPTQPVTIGLCGSGTTLSLSLIVVGLTLMRLTGSRSVIPVRRRRQGRRQRVEPRPCGSSKRHLSS